MTSRPMRLAALAGIALLIAACGGTAATAAPTAAEPTAPPAATEAPTDGQATEAPTEAGATEPAPTMPDLSNIFGSVDLLDSLDRYKISVQIVGAMGTTEMNVTTIREPIVATQVDMNTAGAEMSIIRIADKAWMKQGATDYIEVPAATVTSLTQMLAPEQLLGAFQGQDAFQYLTAVGTETKNGVQATHYHVDDQTQLPAGSETLPPGMVGDIWVSEEGFLVAFEMSGLNTDVAGQGTIESMSIQVTNINDPALTVEEPQ